MRDVGPRGEFPRLNAVDAGGCAVIHGLEAIARLADLRTLDLSRPMQDTDPAPALEALRGLTGLVELDLSGQPALTDLGILSDMRGLRSLAVGSCANLPDVSVLERLTAIERLWMPQCPAIADAWPVTKLPALRRWSRWNTLSMQSKVVTTVLRERKGCDVS